jgi:hypothetical protein
MQNTIRSATHCLIDRGLRKLSVDRDRPLSCSVPSVLVARERTAHEGSDTCRLRYVDAIRSHPVDFLKTQSISKHSTLSVGHGSQQRWTSSVPDASPCRMIHLGLGKH